VERIRTQAGLGSIGSIFGIATSLALFASHVAQRLGRDLGRWGPAGLDPRPGQVIIYHRYRRSPEGRVTEEINRLRERWLPIFHRHRIRKAILFGSWARGEASPRSDLDLIVVEETDKRFFDRYDGLFAELSRAFPERELDLLIYTPEELAAMAGRRFIASALREGRVIYESDG